MSLKQELEDYKNTREGEATYISTFFCCIPLGFSKKVKLDAVDKMLGELDKDQPKGCTYKYEEIDALRNGRLGDILRKHSQDLPECFTGQEESKLQREAEQQQRDVFGSTADNPFPWGGA